MIGKKMSSFRKLASRVKAKRRSGLESSQEERLLKDFEDGLSGSSVKPPTGFFVVYVGDEHERFVVPTSFLSHPLFKMLLEKANNEFDLHQKINRLVLPCSVSTFQEIVSVAECCNGRFDVRNLIEELM
ncbi:hypothetical protein K2173_018614 [Erythroxylum novogranatense]|uniref:Small auxin up regulated protein n=1 Tax=Erythroxylum novogranatense TaxID=1862640 RepID=A0AAV8UAX5_9ROSI|nr:hypothetical protein K2173_018614 [Erythroxylum novogranatense]